MEALGMLELATNDGSSAETRSQFAAFGIGGLLNSILERNIEQQEINYEGGSKKAHRLSLRAERTR
jgi:hypothetical protein